MSTNLLRTVAGTMVQKGFDCLLLELSLQVKQMLWYAKWNCNQATNKRVARPTISLPGLTKLI